MPRVAVYGTEVAVAVHQHIAHGEILSQADQGVIDAGVAVGVIPAQHVAHGGGALAEGVVIGQIVLVHSVEDAAVDRLQTVPDVGKGPAHNDAHGVFNIGFFHLRNQRGFHNLLVRVTDFLGVVLGFFSHLQFFLLI